MSIDQATDTIVTLRPEPNGGDAATLEATPREPEEAAVVTAAPERPVLARRQRLAATGRDWSGRRDRLGNARRIPLFDRRPT
jgi:hypothetical protein